MKALRRAMRRAAKVSVGAVAGAIACAVVGVGGVDGAAVLAPRPSLPMTMVVVAVAALVVTAVIRRVQFTPPTARAQRVSFWLAAATDLADLELALTLVAGAHVDHRGHRWPELAGVSRALRPGRVRDDRARAARCGRDARRRAAPRGRAARADRDRRAHRVRRGPPRDRT